MKNKKKKKLLFAVIGAMLFSFPLFYITGTSCSLALAEDKVEKGPFIDPQVERLMKQMHQYIKEAKEIKFHAEIEFDDVLPVGAKIQHLASMEASLKRPDRMYVNYDGDLGGKEFWYDGKSITLHDADHNVYASFPAAATIKEALNRASDQYDLTVPMADLFSGEAYSELMKNIEYGVYVGLSEVDGILCHHLFSVRPFTDWQVWIEADDNNPLLRKVVINYKDEEGYPQYSARFTNWILGAINSDNDYIVAIPDSADEIEFIVLKELRK